MNKAAFITGGSRGIGRAITLVFAKNGYDIALNYLKEDEKAKAVKEEIETIGQSCILLKGDVADPYICEQMAKDARVYYKNIIVLVNNAGIAYREFFDKVTIQESDRILDTNVKGILNMTRALLPQLKENAPSQIINLSSCWGRVGGALEVHYSLTKGAVNAFTKALAKELLAMNVRVNAIAPGAVETDMLAPLSEEDRIVLKKMILQNKIESPENIAKIALFLESEAAKNMTGEILGSSGGLVI